MTVLELYEQLKRLIDANKGDYRVTCEAGCADMGVGVFLTIDKDKKIILD